MRDDRREASGCDIVGARAICRPTALYAAAHGNEDARRRKLVVERRVRGRGVRVVRHGHILSARIAQSAAIRAVVSV